MLKAHAQDMDKVFVTIKVKNTSLEQLFGLIEKITPYKFNYKTADVAAIKGITYEQEHVSVKKLLSDVTGNTSLQFEQVDNYILVKKVSNPQRTHSSNITIYEFVAAITPLQPVVVAAVATKSNVQRTNTGYHRLTMSEVKKMAMVAGEPDVLKSLQFLPGIQTSAEGTTNLSVRGGSYDQNLILLDDAPVYNPSHTLGFFSAFNADALKDVSIYKGVFPAWYGSRLSSVVDIRMKEGNTKEHTLTGGIGLLASRLTYEGPIKKERSSFIVSGRYSDIGPLLNFSHVSNLIKLHTKDSRVSFYDFNAKFNTLLGTKDRLYLSAYTGYDNFFLDAINKSDKMNWGNTTVSARWNHIFNADLYANTSVLYSNYSYSYDLLEDARNFTWRANLKELTCKTDLDWAINDNNQIRFGAGATLQDVLPGRVIPKSENSTSKEVSLNNRSSAQLFAYLNNEQKISKSVSLSYGVRATGFAALGDALVYRYNADMSAVIDSTYYPKGKITKSYFSMEPRATARVLVSPGASLKLSYARNYQFQHLLTNSSVGLPTDLWLPSDTYFKPQYADQFAAGFYKSILNDSYEGSVEGFFRKSYNIIDFKDNAAIFLNDKIETQILTGQGKGYGVEAMIKKNSGASTGWISYTWSKSLRRINGVNNNEWYSATYDHRHNISIVYAYTVSKRLSLSASWVYRSGGYTTIPIGSYIFYGTRYVYYGKRNGYQLPANHHLDISVTWKNKLNPNKKWQGEWVLSIYNAYSRQNVFAIFISQYPYQPYNVKATQVYLTGILPSLTYNFKF